MLLPHLCQRENLLMLLHATATPVLELGYLGSDAHGHTRLRQVCWHAERYVTAAPLML